MNTTDSFDALRKANPRAKPGFGQSVEAAGESVRAEMVTATMHFGRSRPERARSTPRLRLARVSVVGALVAVAAMAAFLTVGSTGDGPGVASAAAAVKKAATVTAASAERSGTAVVHMTHNGGPWATKTVRWNGANVAIVEDGLLGRGTRELRVVDGTLYGPDAEGGWLALGNPSSIDPDSGTTPDEHLAAVREDIGGVTLHRMTRAMTGLATRQLDDGSTVYSGTVAAGLIARETGFKEGQFLRVLPFGYVAHDEAANPSAPLDVRVTVGAGGVVREIAVTWGRSASAWTYTVSYTDLGATPAPVAPANARSLKDLRRVGEPPVGSGEGN